MPQARSVPSIRDVAKYAKVSPSTVSLVMNEQDGAGDETRRRVWDAIEALGYSRNKRSSKSVNSAVVCSRFALDQGNLISECRGWLQGIRDVFSKAGGHLNVFSGSARCAEDQLFCDSIQVGELRGAILAGHDPGDGYLEYLLSHRIPTVVLMRHTEAEMHRCSYVDVDCFAAGTLAINYLVTMGHKRIAICADSRLGHIQERRAGAEATLKRHGLQPICVSNLHSRLDDAEMEIACREVLESKATAAFVCDWAGARCVETWEKLGVAIPQDLSVMGFGGTSGDVESGRVLTAVDYDKEWLGEVAGKMLLDLLNEANRLSWSSAAILPRIVEGNTTAEIE